MTNKDYYQGTRHEGVVIYDYQLFRGPSAAQTLDLENNTYLVEERERDMRQLEVTDHHFSL